MFKPGGFLPGFFMDKMKVGAIISLVCCSLIVFGQNKSQPDSLQFYKKVEKTAKKKKITYWLYKEIFNIPDGKRKKEKERKRVNYQNYKGRIIRTINIHTFDPFGYNIQDTTKKPSGFVEKTLNFLHQKSNRRAISNQLLYEEGDTLDPLVVKESERILRRSEQIREIVTFIKPVKGTDSVDVTVREHDYWSKSFGLAYRSDNYLFSFSDKNFLGLSHFLKTDFSYLPYQRRTVVSGIYSIPYFKHYLIEPTVHFNSDPYNFFRGFSISRPFISPLFKWAGSAQLYDIKTSGSIGAPEGGIIEYGTRYFIKDFWLGRSFSLSKDTSEEVRVTKLIVGARYSITTFNYYAPEIVAPYHFYENTEMVYLNIGISNRSYYRDYYVYRFGVQEDVPAGRLINLVGGFEKRGSGDRLYGGIEAGTGNHFDNFGYMSMNAAFGTFFRNDKMEQSVLKMGIGYFSDLIELKRTRVRQFAKLSVAYGFNRIRSEYLLLNDEIRGFESNLLTGVKRATLGLQTQAYLPYSFLGFRFAPFIFIDFALIAQEGTSFLDSRVYSGYGLGLIIKNELLVINTFQFAIGIYPFIPEENGMSIRFNPVKSYDFSFADFSIGAPSIVPLK